MSTEEAQPFEYNVRAEEEYSGEEWFYNTNGTTTGYTWTPGYSAELLELEFVAKSEDHEASTSLNDVSDQEKVTSNPLRISKKNKGDERGRRIGLLPSALN